MLIAESVWDGQGEIKHDKVCVDSIDSMDVFTISYCKLAPIGRVHKFVTALEIWKQAAAQMGNMCLPWTMKMNRLQSQAKGSAGQS